MRALNSSLLLNLVWDQGPISRAELARRTGMSRSTVSGIISGLQQDGLVEEVGAVQSSAGRRPVMLAVRDRAFSMIGVEIGARHVTAILTDLRGEAVAFETTLYPVRHDPKGAVETADRLVGKVLKAARVAWRSLIGIGVALPSPIAASAPGQLSTVIFPAWEGIDVREHFRRTYGLPTFVDNDANMGALAERFWGAGAQGDDLVFIKLGAGVGSGHIIGGKLYRGAAGAAGELGHITIDPKGPLCCCGNRGCLTTYVGSEELVTRARESIREADGLTLASLINRAMAGERAAAGVLESAGERLGIVVGTVLNLLNPAVVVLGGEIIQVGDLLLNPLRATVRQRVLSVSFAGTRIVASNLGPTGVALGAATMVLQAALNDQSMFLTKP